VYKNSFSCFIGNFVPIKQKEFNARAKFSANSGNAHGRNKATCFFLPPYINLKLPANLEAVAAKPLCFRGRCPHRPAIRADVGIRPYNFE